MRYPLFEGKSLVFQFTWRLYKISNFFDLKTKPATPYQL